MFWSTIYDPFFSIGKGAWVPRLIRFLASLAVTAFSMSLTSLCRIWIMMSSSVFLVILSVMFENSGLMKNGPRQAIFEAENQKVTFDDVHGVDEAKDVRVFLVAFFC